LVGALVLLVLPLAAAALAYGSYAAANERSRADTRLGASLRAAASEYVRALDDAQLQAMQLADARTVQRALRTRDRRALERLRRAHPNTQFLTVGRRGANAPGAVRRSVEVRVGARPVGTVVVQVALDRALLTRLAHAAGLPQRQEIAVAARGGRVVASSGSLSGPLMLADARPQTVKVGGEDYRAAASAIAPGTRLGVLGSIDAVDAAAASSRDRILRFGLLVLGAVMLMAYALAPALARARVAQQQRVIAERVLAHVADGVLLVDARGIVQFWNRAAETITGLTADRVLGSSLEEAIPGWQVAVSQIPVGDAERFEDSSRSASVPLELEGREHWLAASGVRFADGTVYSLRDVNEDERLDKAKADFVATVSHELRTPLASVYGAALTLQEHFTRLEKRPRDRLLHLIVEQSNRLSAIIDDILLASRLDRGRLNLERERFEAGQVARTVVEAAQVQAPEGIVIELAVPPSLPDATGDPDKVGQVLVNLVQNAVKYSPGGGRVEVAVDQFRDHIRFEVRDQGLGIPLDEQERIFKKFYRLDPNLTRGIGGTGLGLYICHELVRRMGGDIRVVSAPDRGSTFSFDLPVARTAGRVTEPVGPS
jgi:PAS domain S-box-containing protein